MQNFSRGKEMLVVEDDLKGIINEGHDLLEAIGMYIRREMMSFDMLSQTTWEAIGHLDATEEALMIKHVTDWYCENLGAKQEREIQTLSVLG
ncbi:hypothetical protein GPK34_00755 [Secundilactobacillus kimchicus]|uniref:hypothetical protein n=1 Tax=Secundilactobacillus kimchicus TaxID=528209 RepID=UPI001C018A01|nr:hypothetical protein [Secundilactobacillus kimchicus]MBT9670568.1 hypothetical protein [Secundilactobacillus kimchicus]